MLNRFIQSLIQEITKILTKNRNFFEQNNAAREKILNDFKIPSTVKQYLSTTEMTNFMSDLSQYIEYTKNKNTSIANNKLLQAIAFFLCDNFAGDLYKLPNDYFKLSFAEQEAIVSKLISSNSMLGEALKAILTENSSQEISNGIQQFLSETVNAPYIIIQSPVEITPESKKQIKQQLSTELDKAYFPIFQVNRNLIGGMRIFINGKVTDLSWLNRVNFITSLK